MQILHQIDMFYQGRERYAEAFDLFKQAVAADPEAGYAYYQIGRTGVFSGQNKALQLNLDHEEAQKGLAKLR